VFFNLEKEIGWEWGLGGCFGSKEFRGDTVIRELRFVYGFGDDMSRL
jgi:hypothetical protein